MLQRGGEVVIRMLANVKQVAIKPLIDRMRTRGSLVYTDEYDIYSRLVEWGYGHETVCHGGASSARDDDGEQYVTERSTTEVRRRPPAARAPTRPGDSTGLGHTGSRSPIARPW